MTGACAHGPDDGACLACRKPEPFDEARASHVWRRDYFAMRERARELGIKEAEARRELLALREENRALHARIEQLEKED